MVARGGGPTGVRQGVLVAAVDVQGPGERVRGVHGVAAGPFGAGRLQRGLGVTVVGGGQGRVEVGVDAVGAGQRDPGVDQRVLVAGLLRIALLAARLVQLTQFHQWLGQREALHDLLHTADRRCAVALRGLGAGPALESREVAVVGGEGARVVGEGRLVLTLVPGELAQRRRDVRDVAAARGGAQRLLQDAAGGFHVPPQFPDVGVPREDRDAGAPLVGHVGGLRRVVVAAEFDEGVDTGGQGALAVRVLLQRPVRVGQGAVEVVPGGGEGGASGERRVVVGPQSQGAVQCALRLRVAGGVALGAGLLDVREAERRPAAEVLGLGPEVSLEGGDARVQVATGEQLRGHGDRRGGGIGGSAVPDGAEHHGPGGECDRQRGRTEAELGRAPTTPGHGQPADGGDTLVAHAIGPGPRGLRQGLRRHGLLRRGLLGHGTGLELLGRSSRCGLFGRGVGRGLLGRGAGGLLGRGAGRRFLDRSSRCGLLGPGVGR